jgi:hypothetical protein
VEHVKRQCVKTGWPLLRGSADAVIGVLPTLRSAAFVAVMQTDQDEQKRHVAVGTTKKSAAIQGCSSTSAGRPRYVRCVAAEAHRADALTRLPTVSTRRA